MKQIIYIIAVIIAVMAAFFTLQPVQEISFLSPEAETVVSWNFDGVTASKDVFDISSIEKYFSIEKYINEDINDTFYIGIEKYTYDGVNGFYSWYKFRLEAYKDVDAAWINLEIGF